MATKPTLADVKALPNWPKPLDGQPAAKLGSVELQFTLKALHEADIIPFKQDPQWANVIPSGDGDTNMRYIGNAAEILHKVHKPYAMYAGSWRTDYYSITNVPFGCMMSGWCTDVKDVYTTPLRFERVGYGHGHYGFGSEAFGDELIERMTSDPTVSLEEINLGLSEVYLEDEMDIGRLVNATPMDSLIPIGYVTPMYLYIARNADGVIAFVLMNGAVVKALIEKAATKESKTESKEESKGVPLPTPSSAPGLQTVSPPTGMTEHEALRAKVRAQIARLTTDLEQVSDFIVDMT